MELFRRDEAAVAEQRPAPGRERRRRINPLTKQRVFIRNLQAGAKLQSFLVAAVTSILVIRLFLEITGYPQLGGGGLHIAHMLWGGLLMLASIIILLSFLSKASERLAAILGGIGFGTFIDEVGKFVTSDNNYFYQPSVAIMYITFILIFISVRAIHSRQNYLHREYLVNALQEMEEVALQDLDEEEKKRALYYLEKSDPANPLVAALKDSLARMDLSPVPDPWLTTRLKRSIRDLYYNATQYPLFTYVVVGFFVVHLLVRLIYVFSLVFFGGLGWEQFFGTQTAGELTERVNDLTFIDLAELASSLLSGLFVMWGIIRIGRSRLSAFRMFERSVLVSIFLTQVFAFYKEQFFALLSLFFNILVLLTLRFMIGRERTVEAAAVHNPDAKASPQT
ncbi:MAG TPA: hypothetical protein VD966_00570 [Pyrinomonadaceae bacterium]|nr:hypothetical protein [Pyrinomonadaceae bacterium]